MKIFVAIALVFTATYTIGLVVAVGTWILLIDNVTAPFVLREWQHANTLTNFIPFFLVIAASGIACSWRTLSSLRLTSHSPLTIRYFVKSKTWHIALVLSAISLAITVKSSIVPAYQPTELRALPYPIKLLMIFATHAFLVRLALMPIRNRRR